VQSLLQKGLEENQGRGTYLDMAKKIGGVNRVRLGKINMGAGYKGSGRQNVGAEAGGTKSNVKSQWV